MPEVKYDPRKGGPEQRIHDRQKNSGGEECDYTIKTGAGERRTFHNIHHSGHQAQHGSTNEGEAGVDGRKRTVVNTGDGR